MNRMRPPMRPNRSPAGRSLQDRFGISGWDLAMFGGGLAGGLYLTQNPTTLYALVGAGALGLVLFLKR